MQEWDGGSVLFREVSSFQWSMHTNGSTFGGKECPVWRGVLII